MIVRQLFSMSTSTPISEPAATPPPSITTHLDVPSLVRWLAPRLPGVTANLQAQRMDGGQSNPSWLLKDGEHTWVLRAKPAPAAGLLPSAHAIEREYRILNALQGSAVPVPKVRVLCEDESVIGVAFYVMDFVQGRIFRDATLPDLPPDQRAACYMEANRVLAALHQVDWRALGLHDFGRPDGFYTRLIRRWGQQYMATRQTPVEAMERLMDWLPQHIPAGADGADATCITHGDFRMENLMFHPTRPEVVAVLDWELCTLGHPLSDLSYSALAWHMPKGLLRGYADQSLQELALPTEQAYIARYAHNMGLDAQSTAALNADWPFYLAFNLFRLSAILQGIGHRAREGKASSANAHDIATMAEPVARWGWAIAQGLPAAEAS